MTRRARRPRRDRSWVPEYDFDVGRVEYRIEIDHPLKGSSQKPIIAT